MHNPTTLNLEQYLLISNMKKNLCPKNDTIELSDSDDDAPCRTSSLHNPCDWLGNNRSYVENKTKNMKSQCKITSQKKNSSKSLKVSDDKQGTKRRNQDNVNVYSKAKRRKLLKHEIDEYHVNLNGIFTYDSNNQDGNILLPCENILKVGPIHCVEWSEVDYITEIHNIEKHIAKNVVELFNKENTIPFIARYRKYMTNGMEPDTLRALKTSLEQAKVVQQRATAIIKAINKLGKWTPEIHAAIKSTKCLDDLEHIYSQFKAVPKRSLAERAKDIGLESISNLILSGENIPLLSSMVNSEISGLETEQQIQDGIKHIIADIISKNKLIFDRIKLLQDTNNIEIETSHLKRIKTISDSKNKNVHEWKYEMYFNFKSSIRTIKPHQILAINRAESQKIINVKVIIPDALNKAFFNYCLHEYRNPTAATKFHSTIIAESIDYAYKKLIKPLIIRRVRNDMKKRAETASINVFATNIKQLLLSPPVRGKVVLGIDPGFYHGCKLAVVSEHGNILDTAVIYPHKDSKPLKKDARKILTNLVKKHNCTILALGNATACRQTEAFIATLIQAHVFSPLNVSYTIVDEAGASIYSCSAEAKLEFPNLDPNLISAVSIARRLQDPLGELVKVEPKHLGVGMYQHDLPEKQLLLTLNEIVSEAVSFVGVDINTASQCLLKRVAGFNASRANSVIEWRNKFGPFKNREQLLTVKGIGKKSYEQFAGFIRILPGTAITTDSKAMIKCTEHATSMLNFLDQTWIHPESYKIANEFLNYCKCNVEDLGSSHFIEKVKLIAERGSAKLAKLFETNETTMNIIINALTMRKDEDIRTKTDFPIFHDSMKTIDDLSVNASLSGVVRNITHFGAFVDVGVGREGLISVKWCKNQQLHIGQRVEVKIRLIERERNRISLELLKTL